MKATSLSLLLAFATVCASSSVLADDPLGIYVKISDWTTNFAYSAGLQGKFGAVAIRPEYERIGASGDNPDLISLGVTWTF